MTRGNAGLRFHHNFSDPEPTRSLEMAQPSSSQDLLSLLLGGGIASASKVLPDSEFLHQQLPAPISPSIDTRNNASNQAPALPGQATLETLFSSLKNNPPNNARLNNIVSDAGHAELQPHAATPSTSIAQPCAAASSDIHQSPPIDPAEGRNLLLSMLNLREPYPKEASAPRSSSVSDVRAVVEEIGSRQETMSKIDCQSTDEQPREAAGESNPDNHTQSSIPADNHLTPPKVMGREEQGLVTEEQNGTTAGEGSTKQFPEVRQEEQPVSTSSSERRPRPIQPTTPELSSPHPRREDTKDSPSLQDNDAGHVGFHDSANSTAARTSHSNLEESSHTRLGPETPLEEFLLDIQSTEQIPDAEVIDRVPISRFTSPHQYTRGKQIAVNGLIAYGTRAGRVRVIDPDTGARRIKKLHPGLVEDMHISVDQPMGNQGKAIRRLATCFRNSICIWRLPSTFSDDESAEEAAFEIVLEGGMKVDSIRFSPVDAQCLLFTVANAPSVFLLDLRAGYYHQGPRIGLQLKDIDTLRVVDLPAVGLQAIVASLQ